MGSVEHHDDDNNEAHKYNAYRLQCPWWDQQKPDTISNRHYIRCYC